MGNLGINCPKLAHLCIKSNFIFNACHIINLLIGEQVKLFPNLVALLNIDKSTAEGLMRRPQFHHWHLTPICNSLETLLLQCIECNDYGNDLENDPYFYRSKDYSSGDEDGEDQNNGIGRFICDCASHHIPRYLLTFLLRHIPNLEKMSEACSNNFEPSRAVEMIKRVPSLLERTASPEDSTEEEDTGFEAATNNQPFLVCTMDNLQFFTFCLFLK